MARDVSGDGGTGAPNGITSVIVGRRPVSSLGQIVVQEKRGLARSRRTLERLPADADDRVASLETLQHVAHGQRAGNACRTRARLQPAPAWPRSRNRRRARRRARRRRTFRDPVTTRLAAGSIDRIVDCTNRTPGFTMSRYGMADGGRRLVAEHHVELRETEDEHVALVDEHDVDAIAKGVRKNRRQLQSAEACPKHHNACLHPSSVVRLSKYGLSVRL